MLIVRSFNFAADDQISLTFFPLFIKIWETFFVFIYFIVAIAPANPMFSVQYALDINVSVAEFINFFFPIITPRGNPFEVPFENTAISGVNFLSL